MSALRLVAAMTLLALSSATTVSGAEEGLAGLLQYPGVSIKVSGSTTERKISGVRITSGQVGMDLENLVLDPQPGALNAGSAKGGDVAFPDIDDPASGRIRFASVNTSDLRSLPLLISGARCATAPAGISAPVKLSFTDVSLLASRRLLPSGKAPERIEMPNLDVTVRMDAKAECFVLEEVAARSVTTHAIDGASLFLADMRALLRSGSFGGLFEFDLRGLRAMDASRAELMSLGLLRIRGRLDQDPGELLTRMSDIPEPLGRLLKVAELSDPDLEVSVRGLYLPLGRLLPEPERAKLGLDESSLVQGDVSASLSAPGNTIVLDSEINLAGALRMLLELELHAPEIGVSTPGTAPGLPGLSAIVPLLPLEIKSGHLSVRDAGARLLIESATGSLLEDDIVGLMSPLGPMAARFEVPVRAWLREAFFLGAGLDLSPAEPAGILRLGLQAAMDAEKIPDLLGLTVVPPRF